MSTLNGKIITLIGGTGFIGRYTAQRLLAKGARLRIVSRNPVRGLSIKPLGNLGQVQLGNVDILKPASVAKAVESADIVINLVGSFDNMDAIQHRGAQIVAEAAAKARVKQLIHISAIGADADSPAVYGRTKAAGEAAVCAAFPKATILRPSIVFGREDQFINRFANMIRMMPMVPVIGAETKFQPVFVGDVARAIEEVAERNIAGQILELGGSQVLSMLQLNEWIADNIGRKRIFFPVPDFAAHGLAMGTGWLPAAPITLDQYHMLGRDNIVDSAHDGMAALGIIPTPLDSVADDWLAMYRKHGRFGAKAGAAL